MSEAPSYPVITRPLLPSEILRIGAVLYPFGLPFSEGDSMYVAMETAVPHHVIGVFGNAAQASDAIAARSSGAAPAATYGPFQAAAASTPDLDLSEPIGHNYTNGVAMECSVANIASYGRRHSEVTCITVTVNWSHVEGKPDNATWTADRVDALFLTRGSREAFFYPRYLAMHGPAYLAAIRAEHDED